MLSTGHRHRVIDALDETHAHLAPRKHTEACKVQLSVTPGGFYPTMRAALMLKYNQSIVG